MEQITDAVFNGSPSVQSQFDECSNGVFTVSNGGAVEITLDYTVKGRTIDSDTTMKNDMAKLVEDIVKFPLPGILDHVLYCMPTGTTNLGEPDWVAFATSGEYNSYYNDGQCEEIITVMHEIGHNSKYSKIAMRT